MLFPFPHSVFARRVFHYCALTSASFSVKTQGDSNEFKSFNDFSSFVTLSGMEVIGGLVTVLGGVSNTEFLSSVEVLDNSPDSDAPLGTIHKLRKHFYSTKLNLTSKFFTKTVFFLSKQKNFFFNITF